MTNEQDGPRTSPPDDLERLLNGSTPRVSADSPAVRTAVQLMVRASATQPGRTDPGVVDLAGRRRAHHLVAGAGLATTVLLGVSAAAASPLAPGWVTSWVPDRTVTEVAGGCDVESFRVLPRGTTADDPSVTAAREYLAGLDMEDVDISGQLAEQRASAMVDEDGTPTGETAGDVFTEQELESGALLMTIIEMVRDEVERQGLDGQLVGFEAVSEGCGQALVP